MNSPAPRLLVQLDERELAQLIREGVQAALAAQGQGQGQVHDPDELLGVAEAARALRCSSRTVRRMVATGRLRAAKLGDGGSSRVLIARAEVRRLLREARV